MQKARKSLISKKLKIDANKIEFFDHQECHAYYGYYGSDFKNQRVTVVTCDGGGDNSNATIWVSTKKNKLIKLKDNLIAI